MLAVALEVGEDLLRVGGAQRGEVGVELAQHLVESGEGHGALRVGAGVDPRLRGRVLLRVLGQGAGARGHHAERVGVLQLLRAGVQVRHQVHGRRPVGALGGHAPALAEGERALAGRTGGQRDHLVGDVGVVGLHGAVEPVALDGHGGLALAEGLAAPVGVDLVGVLHGAGLQQGLHVGQRLRVLRAVGGHLRLVGVGDPAAGLLHEDAEPGVFGTHDQPGHTVPGQLARDLLQLVPGRRVVLLGQPRLLPQAAVDRQRERGGVLGQAHQLAVVGEGGAQLLGEVVGVLDLVAVGVQGAASGVVRELVGVDVEGVRRLVPGERLGELLVHVLGDVDGHLVAGLLGVRGRRFLDGLGLGVAGAGYQHRQVLAGAGVLLRLLVAAEARRAARGGQ